jgi:hypothetical protein
LPLPRVGGRSPGGQVHVVFRRPHQHIMP